VVKLNDKLIDAIEAGKNFLACFAASSLRPTQNMRETYLNLAENTYKMTPGPTLYVNLAKILFKSFHSPTHEPGSKQTHTWYPCPTPAKPAGKEAGYRE
jgi:hypothetical protein